MADSIAQRAAITKWIPFTAFRQMIPAAYFLRDAGSSNNRYLPEILEMDGEGMPYCGRNRIFRVRDEIHLPDISSKPD